MTITSVPDMADEAVLDAMEDWAGTHAYDAYRQEALRRMDDGWISVERDLPDTCRQVLIAYEEGTVSTATWLPEQGDFQGRKLQYITHWRELPTPPSERDE